MDNAWLTAVRVERLHKVLRAISSFPPSGIVRSRAERVVWTGCGGPLDEVSQLVKVLVECDLATDRDGRLRINKAGRLIATQDHQQGGRLLGLALIRAGRFAEQARLLTELGSTSPEGELVCPRQEAQKSSPQLIGVLRRWPEVEFAAVLRVPPELAKDLLDVWAIIPSRPRDELYRLSVGDRAEMYSYRLERLNAQDVSAIHWVSREDERLGYDVEDVSKVPSRLIEVKGSGGQRTRFFLSANEWRVAHSEELRFEIQYWGEIDLSVPPEREYEDLRQRGFPVVYRRLNRLIGAGSIEVRVDTYEVSEPGIE
jgi:hypothetical protein